MNSAPQQRILPRHVAIIMDGNGRWARKRHLPRQAGHAAGVAAVRGIVRAACEVGLTHLTLYAFSSENWKRPPTEVGALMGLFRAFFHNDMKEIGDLGVKVRIIGTRSRVENDISSMIYDAEKMTANNNGLNLTFAFDYGSQEEILHATREIAQEVKDGKLDPAAITPQLFASKLFTATMPDPDLIIRTSGERRISNFLLWQAAYAELMFVDTLWPDFDRTQFLAAIEDFANRERRFGALQPGAVA